MPAVYSGGTIINATEVAANISTKNALSDWIKDQLVLAGWSVVSGSSGSWVVQSAATHVGVTGLSCRIVMNNAATNCLRIYFARGSGVDQSAAPLYLLPNVDYRIVANRYQFFVFSAGAAVPRQYIAGGQLYVPSYYGAPACAIWAHSSGTTDTDVSARHHFRSRLIACNANGIISGLNPNSYQNYNGNPWSVDNQLAFDATPGGQRLAVVSGAVANPTVSPQINTMTNYYFIYEPLMMWGLTGANVQAKIAGQIWDAYVTSQSVAADTLFTFDGHTFIAVTNNNTPAADTGQGGTLLVAVS